MSWDVSTAWEVSAAAEWERICEAGDRYNDAVEAAADTLKEEIERYLRISGMLEDGYDWETDEDLTVEQINELQRELIGLDDYIDAECDCYEVERADVLEVAR